MIRIRFGAGLGLALPYGCLSGVFFFGLVRASYVEIIGF